MGQKEYMTSAIVDNMDVCVICKSPREQIHHIFRGANRDKATKYGYILPLCAEHHTGNTGIHSNRAMNIHFRQIAQRHYEEHHGNREQFIEEFGKSWI